VEAGAQDLGEKNKQKIKLKQANKQKGLTQAQELCPCHACCTCSRRKPCTVLKVMHEYLAELEQ
jgi:hypothetical protein